MDDDSNAPRLVPRPLSLFDPQIVRDAKVRGITEWPENQRFPLNFDQRTVEDVLVDDIKGSCSPLIITGYTSLDYLIDIIADLPEDSPESVSILLGSEPSPGRRARYSLKSETFNQEVTDYWLDAGISLRLCHKVVLFMDLINQGRVRVRCIADQSRKLHAKIYLTDAAATLGSSNFSFTGFRRQLEANARFDAYKEPKRYRELRRIADNYWSLGEEYRDELLALLSTLLKVVSWEEALGRACGELLEGEWAQRYIKSGQYGTGHDLWPSQKVGIAQALWMVENVGSVLIADATGSGKTRMGAYLLRAIMDRIWSTGRARKDLTLMVCPPNIVQRSWEQEAEECGLPLRTMSHGILSRRTAEDYIHTMHVVRRAQSLAVDEAHNFLNSHSSRTRSLFGNMADVVLLFTATPINKGIGDLLRIVDLLGADNLEESALHLFDRLEKRARKYANQFVTSREERLQMQKEVQRFTLRRTKAMLNAMVDQEPDRYLDDHKNPCRYPKHLPKTYRTAETAADQELAHEIRDLARQLKGLVNLRSGVDIPVGWQGRIDREKYVRGRLLGARGLAIYHVMSRLRSSRAALVEHLLGTEQASLLFQIEAKIKAEDTGNVVGALEATAETVIESSVRELLPRWLVDPEEHALAVAEELQLYRTIVRLVEQMCGQREAGKARMLLSLADSHPLLLAFDSCLITLEVIKQSINALGGDCETIVATGSQAVNRKRVNKLFALGSTAERVIALCSDAMSEGLNLQQASAVVLLDMPSVIRVAEQRVGRVDRMNSPHKQIEVWWPLDSDAFSLKTDKKFYRRYFEVRDILGSNINLPENLVPEEMADGPATADEMIKKLEEIEVHGETWDGIHDAFQPVRDLVDPEHGLVSREVYEQVRHSKARVLSSIGLVTSRRPWGFFAISNVDRGAPKWVFLDGPNGLPVTHLEKVAQHVRGRLSQDHEDHPMDEAAAALIDSLLRQILKREKDLLPRKKQRVLEEMSHVLEYYGQRAKDEQRWDDLSVIETLKKLLEPPTSEQQRADLDTIAETWLDLTRDVWYDKLKKRKGLKPLRLKHIRNDLKKNPIPTHELKTAFSAIPTCESLYTRVVAAIVGVPTT